MKAIERLDQVQMDEVHLTTPVSAEAIRTLKLGDVVYLSGMLYTGREGVYRQVVDKGVALPEDFAEDRMKFAATTPPGFKASLLHDLERGNRLELDWLAGRVVALGRELGVPTPMNAAVYAVLKLHRMGAG